MFGTIYEHKLMEIRRQPCPSFGPNYYKGFASAYRNIDAESGGRLIPGEANLPLQETMIEALMKWQDTDKQTGPIIEWMFLQKQAPFMLIELFRICFHFCFCL